jgi:hypothetical protein
MEDLPSLFMTIFLLMIFLCVYFLPAMIAQSRQHVDKVPIAILNLFFG